ncbi:unnamed protein product [Urochloa humidicola]
MLLIRVMCLYQLLLLLLLVATATHLATAKTSSIGHNRGGDKSVLVSFKEKISSHSGVLDSWNQSTSLQLVGSRLQQETQMEGGNSGPHIPGPCWHHLPCNRQPHIPALTRPEQQQPSRRDPSQHRIP